MPARICAVSPPLGVEFVAHCMTKVVFAVGRKDPLTSRMPVPAVNAEFVASTSRFIPEFCNVAGVVGVAIIIRTMVGNAAHVSLILMPAVFSHANVAKK